MESSLSLLSESKRKYLFPQQNLQEYGAAINLAKHAILPTFALLKKQEK